MKISQCCNCGKNFEVRNEEVLFCSSSCKREHNIFTLDKDKLIFNYFLDLCDELKTDKKCQALSGPAKNQ